MAPNKKAKIDTAPTKATEHFSTESSSLDASQSQDRQAANLQKAHTKNRQKIQQRREQQKKNILANHEARQKQLKVNIAECLKNYDEEVGDIRRPKIERLLELAQQKRVIEDSIEKCHSELHSMFLSTANKLQAVLNDRIESLSE